jgi:hypothetical protein
VVGGGGQVRQEARGFPYCRPRHDRGHEAVEHGQVDGGGAGSALRSALPIEIRSIFLIGPDSQI